MNKKLLRVPYEFANFSISLKGKKDLCSSHERNLTYSRRITKEKLWALLMHKNHAPTNTNTQEFNSTEVCMILPACTMTRSLLLGKSKHVIERKVKPSAVFFLSPVPTLNRI